MTNESYAKTERMRVGNMAFLLERMAEDCTDLQFVREFTKNSIEAIQRLPDPHGKILWDIDDKHFEKTGVRKLSIVDTGLGMSAEEMLEFVNQLSSSSHEQSHTGNYGVGGKISAVTRNPAGVIYRSWRRGEKSGTMVQLWKDPEDGEYGFRRFKINGAYLPYLRISDEAKPSEIRDHGTVVTFIGAEDDTDTVIAPPGTPSPQRWVLRYLNGRFFDLPVGIEIRALASLERDQHRVVTGQRDYLFKSAVASGSVELDGATAHWWILNPIESSTNKSGFQSTHIVSGHVAALYQDELYDVTVLRGSAARLQNFGIIFGYNRVVIYVEPHSDNVKTNTARTNLIIDGEPLPWSQWAAEFREHMPSDIAKMMDEQLAGSSDRNADYKQAIRNRIRSLMDLFRFSRYRPSSSGDVQVADEGEVTGGVPGQNGDVRERDDIAVPKTSGRGGRSGDVYKLFVVDDGIPAESVLPNSIPNAIWISSDPASGLAPRLKNELEDRAAQYVQIGSILKINADFRGFIDMIDRWDDLYGRKAGYRPVITDVVREWFEQRLTETVLGIVSLRNKTSQWTEEDTERALSPEALTSAVMPRWEIDYQIKRNLATKLGATEKSA